MMIILSMVMNGVKGEDRNSIIHEDNREYSIVELEKEDQQKENNEHHVEGQEEECKKIDRYYELVAGELIAGRRINWRFLHDTGLFEYLYEEKTAPELKKQLAQHNAYRAEETIKSAIEKGIGTHDFYAFQNEIDMLSCRFQNKPECLEVWDTLVAKYAQNIQDATSPFVD